MVSNIRLDNNGTDHLPDQDAVAPHVGLGGVQVVAQGLGRHPLDRH